MKCVAHWGKLKLAPNAPPFAQVRADKSRQTLLVHPQVSRGGGVHCPGLRYHLKAVAERCRELGALIEVALFVFLNKEINKPVVLSDLKKKQKTVSDESFPPACDKIY